MQTIHGRMAKTALRSFKVINKIDNNLAAVYYAGSILSFSSHTLNVSKMNNEQVMVKSSYRPLQKCI